MGRRMDLHLRAGSQLKSGHPSSSCAQSHIAKNNSSNCLSTSLSEGGALMQACFHCSFHMAADLTRVVQKEELTERGGRRSPALACRLLTRKERG